MSKEVPVSEGERAPSEEVKASQGWRERFSNTLQCSLCLDLMYEPVSINCGHSFCRLCISSSLARHKKACPTCRAPCDPEDLGEVNNVIKQFSALAFPELYQARALEDEEKKSSNCFPIYFHDSVAFPGSSISLRVFEPRHKLMMQRVTNSSGAFAHLSYFPDEKHVVGGVAVLAKVEEVELMEDGGVLLKATMISRHIITDAYVEDGYDGLHVCRLEDMCDEPIDEDLQNELQELLLQGRMLVSELRRLGYWCHLQDLHGEEPHSPEDFSLWLVSITKTMSSIDKIAFLKSTNTLERLRAVMESLTKWVRDAVES